MHYRLRQEPKIRRVVGVRDAVDQARVDAGGGEDGGKLGMDVHGVNKRVATTVVPSFPTHK